MKIAIEQELACKPVSYIELPVDSWSQIVEWFVRDDKLFYKLADGVQREIELKSPHNVPAWSDPVRVIVWDAATGYLIEDTENE